MKVEPLGHGVDVQPDPLQGRLGHARVDLLVRVLMVDPYPVRALGRIGHGDRLRARAVERLLERIPVLLGEGRLFLLARNACAGATLAVLPPLVMFVLLQRFFVDSIVSSGVKG